MKITTKYKLINYTPKKHRFPLKSGTAPNSCTLTQDITKIN